MRAIFILPHVVLVTAYLLSIWRRFARARFHLARVPLVHAQVVAVQPDEKAAKEGRLAYRVITTVEGGEARSVVVYCSRPEMIEFATRLEPGDTIRLLYRPSDPPILIAVDALAIAPLGTPAR